MKIHIIYPFQEGPWGGSNQFAMQFKAYLERNEQYAGDPKEADAFLFVSSNGTEDVIRLKKKFPAKPFVQRLDGPMKLYNAPNDLRDDIAWWANEHIADATIFQSNYSKAQNIQLGMKPPALLTVIHNAVNERRFNQQGKMPFSKDRKTKLIATSWSTHPKKGFATYQWLDQHLDFKKYNMSFVGRSPVAFKNIQLLPPTDSEGIAAQLKTHDIFITASENESCSNALLEALACGLPAIAHPSGGTPELLPSGGLLYDTVESIPVLLEQIIADYNDYQQHIEVRPYEQMARDYLVFTEATMAQTPTPKQLKAPALLRFKYLKGKQKVQRISGN